MRPTDPPPPEPPRIPSQRRPRASVTTAAQACRVLGVPAHASVEQRKAAWRRLVRALHPDSPGGGDPQRFAEVQEAHVLLEAQTPGPGTALVPAARPYRAVPRPPMYGAGTVGEQVDAYA